MGTPPLEALVDVSVERGQPWPVGPVWARARRTSSPVTADLVEATRRAIEAAAFVEPTTIAVLIAATHADVDVATDPLREAVASWVPDAGGLTTHLFDEIPMFTYLRGLVSVQGQHVAQMANGFDDVRVVSTLAVTGGDAEALARRTASTPLEGDSPQGVLLLEVQPDRVRARLWRAAGGEKKPVFVHAGAIRSALGDTEQTWQQVLRGQSGITRSRPTLLDGVPCAPAEARVAGDWHPRTEALALSVSQEVLPERRSRLGVVYAPMWPGHQGSEADDWTHSIGGPVDADNVETELQPDLFCRIEATCAGGVRALIEAARMVAAGEVDDAIAVAAVARNNPYHLSQFAQLTALSTWSGDPTQASRPFAPDRAGMVMAEGAAAVLFSAQPSDIDVDAAAVSVDTSSPTAPSAEHIERVLRPTWLPGSLVSAHGTGTAANDDAEAAVLSGLCPQSPVFAAKAMTGHASSASGLIEVVLGVRALRAGLCPPTPHAHTAGVSTTQTSTPASASSLVKSSFGFGGQYASVRLTRRSDPA